MSPLYKKNVALNQLILELILDESNLSIVKKFTDGCVEIMGADFGFAWGKFEDNSNKLVYKSPTTPKNISLHGNDEKNLTIPVRYGDHVYGRIVLCYLKKKNFSKEETSLTQIIGNVLAQSITINWLIANETKTLALAKKQKETEILLAQEKLKTEFIANATHELRTPLAIMKGNADLALLSKGDAKTMQKALKEVNAEIKILSDILRDLALLTSSGQNARHILNRGKVDVSSLAAKVVSRLRTLAGERNMEIKLNNKGAKSGLFVSGDEHYLEKIFLNLLRNGIAYGKKGGRITVDLSKKGADAEIKVADNGIGISKEDLPKIFERFYRADKSRSGHGSHSGLGLPIVKWAAEIHGGEIRAESRKGKGSTFTVRLPLSK